ncbi:RHOMBOID-like protein 3 [Arabidopsis thaliana]|uniref:Isoform 2 of RHOMBOID-like protein 3 n=1 Tax=Arabidopsis thaliana TaxID=3702 RepID=Q9LYP1-2|nr:RHOMBOID-like protein 3 [Arabidopsis thaliana]AED91128.1 RHOMBOID-like protein 3 [Arabidopsis thaliana]|eukprot:NP_001119182.1 RHOMBOID-like protein 3 [Arabidopsis thaliana]
MAVGDDDLENRMSAKDRGIGSRGGDRNRIGPPPLPVALSSSTEFGDNALSSRWTSWLVPMFVVANVAVFVVAMFVNNCPNHFESHRLRGHCVAKFLGRLSFEPLRTNPLFGPSSHTLEKLGALEWSKVVEKKEGWRLLTCIWLHAGVIHLGANMLSLVFIGIRLEQQFGFVRIGVIYLLSGIGGSVLSSLFIRNSISVGASGALFGLLGSMLSELFTNWTIYSNKFKWLAREHMPQGTPLRYKYKTYQYLLWLLSLVLLIAGFVVALLMLFRGENGNDHCRWCHYLRCVPTSSWRCDDV